MLYHHCGPAAPLELRKTVAKRWLVSEIDLAPPSQHTRYKIAAQVGLAKVAPHPMLYQASLRSGKKTNKSEAISQNGGCIETLYQVSIISCQKETPHKQII